MVHAFLTNPKQNPYLLALTFVSVSLIPFPVIAETETQTCTEAQKQIEQTQNTLRPLEQHQQQLQKHVRTIYQELFACKTGRELSRSEQQKCSQLQEEGPKNFQDLIKVITLSHQTSQQLAHQTQQAQLACPAIAEDTSSKVSRLRHS